ncbi:hypothetical protein [Noviherbaspirillum sp. Root189]|uniref:hypothetical protein n=1 Tax=Noviherbaspirillum sp. Root189 TaxID=1736487 RepID=UPI00070F6D68|nr:hypothetical protein [Noviherbaspirillum sp. Root189]KRB85195.1 hypothetical protein ASE07_21045 [Noviherbaspirillum sp. Root189]
MPNKADQSSRTAPIKWTDDEWVKIANQLLLEKGDSLLSSKRLEEIKAKDVFNAQELFPEDRHRKLVSIAQGFEGIREKLRPIFQRLGQARQNDLFRQEAGSRVADESMGNKSGNASASQAASGHEPVAESIDTTPTAVDTQQASGKEDIGNAIATGQPAENTPAAIGSESNAGQTGASAPALPARSAEAEAAPAPHGRQAHEDRRAARAQADQDFRQAQAQRREQSMQNRNQPRGPQATAVPDANLVEAARPFVAMVCQELARAFVNALSDKGSSDVLRSFVETTAAQVSSMQSSGTSGARNAARAPQQQTFNKPAQVMRQAVEPEQAIASGHADALEDEGVHPGDVQPLFDPKLPPSADSEFKPNIGIVGTSSDQFDDLRQRYPQLMLTVVPVDAIRSGNVFRQCQRIIGLSDEMPPGTDELLRRSLAPRYIRLTGGIDRVKEQLNHWLDKPGSINAGPRNQGQHNRNGKKFKDRGQHKGKHRRPGPVS